jgi:UDP-N-acetylmuramate dehydrogenase
MIGGGIIMNAGTYMGTFADILRKIYYINNDGESCALDINPSMTSYRTLNVTDICAITGAEFELKPVTNIKESQKLIKEILDDRAAKHPLEYPSAGSVFKNPQGHSSWQLIDNAGLKGAECGGAAVSTKHTNFIINKNNATSSDILSMIQKVQDEVYNKFGISLETEVKMIGEF